MFGKSILLAALSATVLTLPAQDVTEYIDIRPGTLPILLTVPHGGDLKPESILARRYGVTTKDANTAELSLMIMEEMQQQFGGAPHTVICRLHRSKVDCNRELEEATQGDPIATAAWQRFHGAATEIRKQITQKFGSGLTLDLHGHRHEDPRVELGYLITGTQLNVSDAALNTEGRFKSMSSIHELARRSPLNFAELIRGPQSLGALLEARDFNSIPSPSKPSPGSAIYFSGSYTVLAHGSRDSGSISAIQIECPWEGVRDTEPNQRRFAKAFTAAVGEYFGLHFQFPLAPVKQ